MCWIRAVPGCLVCFQLLLVAVFSPACQELPACCSRVFPGPACQLLSPRLLWLSHCPVPFSLGHKTAFSSMERSCWCCFVSAPSPHAFVRAFKNLLWWICASTTLGKQTPCRVFLSFCLFQDEILGIICRIAFMTVLTVLSGHFKPPRFR